MQRSSLELSGERRMGSWRRPGSEAGGFDERELIDRLTDALVRGTIVVIRTPHSIMATVPPERIEPSYEPHAPEEIVEPESVWLGASAEPETLEFETSHQHLAS